MDSETLVKCAHPPCQCLVEEEQNYCSSACSKADGASRGPCMCGHRGCHAGGEIMESDDVGPLAVE
jgi:hypothetical protein